MKLLMLMMMVMGDDGEKEINSRIWIFMGGQAGRVDDDGMGWDGTGLGCDY